MRRGQVAVFVIIALVIFVGLVGYFIFRGSLGDSEVPQEFQGVYQNYLSCIEEQAKSGLDIAGTQGGRIQNLGYESGSEFAPTGNQLNFLGWGVGYWYYITGNGLVKEQVPSRNEIEQELENYIELNIQNCGFDEFYSRGFNLDFGEADVDVNILEEEVNLVVNQDLVIENDDSGNSARKSSHEVSFGSEFGRFYDTALGIYEKQKEEGFLEDYGIDVLRLYAPVDGVEIQCNPKIWSTNEVFEDIRSGLEANVQKLKFEGGDYELQDEKKEYYVIDSEVGENVNVLYNKNWPTKIEIEGEGVGNDLIIAEGIGNQEGLGVMGFCYVPYHYVYDLSFPVLIQVYNQEEVFQFPVVVVVDNNQKGVLEFNQETLENFNQEEEFDLCEYNNQEVEVRLYDTGLNEVDGLVSYECFDQRCRIGETENGVLEGNFPGCVNGYVHVRSDGFEDKKVLFSSNEENFVDVVLDRKRDVGITILREGEEVEGIVSFSEEDGESVTAILPEVDSVELSEGLYDIKAWVYSDTSITIPASTKRECTDVPQGGVFGIFGATEEKCFNIEIPETEIAQALVGGGKLEAYLFDSDLQSGSLEIEVESFAVPRSLEELQYSFASWDEAVLDINLEGGA
jgi:hypothetical protein